MHAKQELSQLNYPQLFGFVLFCFVLFGIGSP
jgi:hypothetical protein